MAKCFLTDASFYQNSPVSVQLQKVEQILLKLLGGESENTRDVAFNRLSYISQFLLHINYLLIINQSRLGVSIINQSY